MKITFLCLTAISQIALSALAESIQKIPLYHKRSSKSDFVSADSEELQNGMLGGIVQIGNPPQNFTLAFDTSVGVSWVRSNQCGDENCANRNGFDATESTTVISTGLPFNLDYGGGTYINTTIYLDTLRFSSLTVKNMPFGSAFQMKGFEDGFDGFLGLGRDISLNTTTTQYAKRDIPASGFVPNAYQQNTGLQSAQFGMYTTSSGSGFSESGTVSSTTTTTTALTSPIAPAAALAAEPASMQQNTVVTSGGYGTTSGGFGAVKRHYQGDEPAGYLVVGGIDTDAIKGKLYHIKVDNDHGSGNWAVPVHQAGFVDDLHFKVCKKAKAILSSSTDVIGLPDKQADEFKKHWYAKYDKDDNTYKIPCCLTNRLKSFHIQLGDIKVTLPPHYWSHRRHVDDCCEMCRTHIGRSDSKSDYIIGSAFTNAFYTQYDSDKDRISLAFKKGQKPDGLKLSDV